MTSAKERADFDQIFEKVLAELPDQVHELLEDVALIIEDEPSAETLQELGITAAKGEADLCGLHTGVPLSEHSIFESGAIPTQIQLFRGPIYRLAGWDSAELEQQIRITLLHEIGHLFGLSEEYLHELGYE